MSMRKYGHLRPAKTAAPLPAPPPPPGRISRRLLIGAIGIALPMLLHAILLPVWGEGTTPLFVVFLLSLLPATGVAFVCGGGGLLRIGYAMCIVIGAAFVSLSLHEARIFGSVPSLDAAAAPSRPAAAGFLLPRAAPRADLAREVEARISLPRHALRGPSSGSMTLRGRFTVVPVVGHDWTPAQPVAVVAVLDHGPDGVIQAVTPAPWDAGGGVLRLLPDPLRDHAVRQALAQAGWTAAPGIVVGRWVADPRWARLDAAEPLLWLFAAALLGLALVILSRHPWIAARLDPFMEGPPPNGSLPVGRAILQGIAALTLPSLLALGLRHAGVDPGVMFLAIGFAAVPSLMMTIGGLGAGTPIGVVILGVILVVTLPMAVLARGAGPNGTLPSLDGARWADVQEAMIVLGVGWLAWAVLVIVGRALAGRGGSGAAR
jgi:hypothetical protein